LRPGGACGPDRRKCKHIYWPCGALRVRSQMDRLLERFFGEPLGPERPTGMWTPRADVTETKDSVTISGGGGVPRGNWIRQPDVVLL
jgi:hypothetical protein